MRGRRKASMGSQTILVLVSFKKSKPLLPFVNIVVVVVPARVLTSLLQVGRMLSEVKNCVCC